MALILTLYRNWSVDDTEEFIPEPGASFPPITNVGGSDWTKAGSTFVEWNTERDGTGTSYPAESEPPISGSCYAIWAAIITPDISIKYNNATIVTMSASGTEVLETNGKIMRDDITIEYSRASATLQTKTVTPTTSVQTVTPDSGYDGLSSVNVRAITPTKSAQTYTPGTTNQTIQSGRWLTGAQTILGDANLLPENIAENVTIFGVTGTHSGGGAATVNLVVTEESGTIDQKALPPGTTWTHRTDTPWISDVVIPANSIFVAESAFGSPAVSNVTLTEWRVGTRPPVFIQTFTVGTQDGTITYGI